MTKFDDTSAYAEAIERQHEITDLAAAVWDLDYIETPDEAAPVDALLARDGFVRAVIECKARNLTRDEFLALDRPPRSANGHSGYLITAHKLTHGAEVGAGLLVPYLVLVGLYPSREVWYWEAWRPGAGWRVKYSTDVITTQRSVDGGTARRECAFLPISEARQL